MVLVTAQPAWGNSIEQEVRLRIRVSVAAYAYEIANKPIMSDAIFDWLASKVQRTMGTCHPLLDEFFAVEFSAMTGMWIHKHPELDGIASIFTRYYTVMRDHFESPQIQKLLHRRAS
jgi:hypothetical protein